MPVHTLLDGRCSCDRPGCPDPAKHPLSPNGVRDASSDLRALRGWHGEAGGVENWAVATGPESGLWVLDIDPRHGGDDALARLLAEHGPLPDTWAVATGGGGRHYYFRWPPGAGIPSKANAAPGVDVRGRGGYAICPPSVHASGGSYLWIVGPDGPLAEAPAWLVTLAAGQTRQAPPSPTARPVAAGSPVAVPPVASGGLIVAAGPDDLTTCPGVAEGRRNARLCELVGRHIARGEDEEGVLRLALAWAERCEPPCDEHKVRDTVRRLAAKHGRSAPQHHPRDDEPDAGSLDPAVANERTIPTSGPPTPFVPSLAVGDGWPVLHADAYHGLAGDILRAIAPQTEADEVGVLLTLLAGVGSILGRGTGFAVGPDRQQANLFVALVGDTASGKGQSWGVARHLLRHADPLWADRCITFGMSSGEGLIERVKDGDTGEADADPPPADKRLLALETEFGKTMTAMRREGNVLSGVLRAAWDGQTLEVLTRKGKLRAADAHVGIVAHVTPEELSKCLARGTEVSDGFANRFLWGLVRSDKCLPHGGDIRVLDPFQDRLAAAAAWALSTAPLVRRTAEADRLWEAVYPSLKASRPGAWGKATERARPQVMRLALLYAVLDKSTFVTEAHLKAGLAVWGYCCRSAQLIFADAGGPSPNSAAASVVREEPLAIRVLGLIRATPGIGRTQMHERLGNKVKAGPLDEAVEWLEEHLLAHRRTVGTGGRPAERWWPGPDPGGASERTIDPPEPDVPEGLVRSLAGAVPVADGQVAEPEAVIVTSESGSPPPPPLPLPELIAAVTAIGGRFVNDNGGVAVKATVPVPEAVLTAVAAHQDQLRAVVPRSPIPGRASPEPSAEWRASYEAAQAEYQRELRRRRGDDGPPMTEDEFFAELNKHRPTPPTG